MKKIRILQMVGVCSGLMAMQSQAALLVTGQNSTSPFYADFDTTGLNVSYVTNSTGTGGTFTASSTTRTSTGNTYVSGAQAAGTQGHDNTGFTGYYTLNATIQGSGSSWEVTGGTVDIYGNLLGGSSSTLLLSANLKAGFNAFGYGPNNSTKVFDFLFTVSSGDGLGQSDNALILQDFFGAGTGQGAIILNVGGYDPLNTYTTFTKDFSNTTGSGFADTFVPEPAFYTMGGGLMALSGLVLIRRPQAGKASAV